MKKIAFILPIIALVAVILIPNYNLKNSDQEKKIEHLIYHYQDTYVGDNSSVGGILNNIFLSESIESFKLGTTDAPYSITVNYVLEKSIKNDLLSQYMEYNATTLFAFVKNVDLITFNVKDSIQKTYAFKRETIQTNYKQNLLSYTRDEQTWMNEVFLNIIK